MNLEFDHQVLTKKETAVRRAAEIGAITLFYVAATGAFAGLVLQGIACAWNLEARFALAFMALIIFVSPYWFLPLPSSGQVLSAAGRVRLQKLAGETRELAPVIQAWLRDDNLVLRREDLAACEEYAQELRNEGREIRGWQLQGKVS